MLRFFQTFSSHRMRSRRNLQGEEVREILRQPGGKGRPGIGAVVAGCAVAFVLSATSGCLFDERSFPKRPQDLVRLGSPPYPEDPENTRQWLTNAHSQLATLLPRRGQRVLLTEQMIDDQGRPRDVFEYFDRDPDRLMDLIHNWRGIVHTAQAVSRELRIDQPAPPWPGFEEIQIPVGDEVRLSGRLGLAEFYGQVSSATCIVLLPGLYGDNGVLRTRDLALALRRGGFHVLALELRGHGRTEFHYPEVPYTFGVLETQDLLIVSQWLKDHYPAVRETGLVGFCWGGNLALLAAWFDGRAADDDSISPPLARIFGPPPSRRQHYTAGILAFSPVLRWEEIVDRCDQEWDMATDAAMYYFQQTVRERKERKEFPEVSGNLRQLIAGEVASSPRLRDVPLPEAYRFLRLMPYRDLPCGNKLEAVRVPALMVAAVNDPFLSAQDLADLTATISNPRVASMILRGGGHIGFAPYNRAYYYSLIVNFFEPHRGAAVVGGLVQKDKPAARAALSAAARHEPERREKK